MFFFHFRNLAPLPDPLALFAPYGNLGVTFFFVLSGFVLTWSWNPTTTVRTFYWRRIARIYPLHVVTLILAIPVFYALSPETTHPWSKPFDLGILVLCLFLLQGWFRSPDILFAGNPASWTLTAELFFYAVHPFAMRPLKNAGVKRALWLALIVVVLALGGRAFVIADPNTVLAELPWPILRLYEFLFGMCLAWAFRRGWRPRIPIAVPYVLLTLWVIGLLLAPRLADSVPGAGMVTAFSLEGTAVLCGVLIVASASRELRGKRGWSGTRAIVTLGEWSYAFYLVHATVLYAALDLFGPQRGGWVAAAWFVATLAASIAIAAVLHTRVERPVEARMRAWRDARDDQRVTANKDRG